MRHRQVAALAQKWRWRGATSTPAQRTIQSSGQSLHLHVARVLCPLFILVVLTHFSLPLPINRGFYSSSVGLLPTMFATNSKVAQSKLKCNLTMPSPTFLNGSIPTALASYPGSGSTLTRLLLELATGYHTGSVYGDISLLNNTAHPFLGEFHQQNVLVVKSHYPVGPTHGPEFEFRDAQRVVLILRHPREAIPSYLNYIYGLQHGADHSMQAPQQVWEEWRDDNGRIEKEMMGWVNVTKHWVERALLSSKPRLHLHIVRFEDLVSKEDEIGIDALQQLVGFLLGSSSLPTPTPSGTSTHTHERIRCARVAVFGERSTRSEGIHRLKRYVPAYTKEQDEIIDGELRSLVDWCEGEEATTSSSSVLCKVMVSYSGREDDSKLTSTELGVGTTYSPQTSDSPASVQVAPAWPPPSSRCKIPIGPNSNETTCGPNGEHLFDCHISVCANHLIPQQVERYAKANLHEPHETKLFSALMLLANKDEVFVDVGAAIGYYAVLALKINPTALVYAFNPNVDFQVKMGTNVALNFIDGRRDLMRRVCVDGRALSDKDGETDVIGSNFGGQLGVEDSTGGNEVSTVRLDTVLYDVGQDPYLLMMDIQGMELPVLNSTFSLLKTGRIKILAVGIHENSLEECRSIIERSGAYTIVVAEATVPLQPDGMLVAIATDWPRRKRTTELVQFANAHIDLPYDEFVQKVRDYIGEVS